MRILLSSLLAVLLLTPVSMFAAEKRGTDLVRVSPRTAQQRARAPRRTPERPTMMAVRLTRVFHSDGYRFSMRYPDKWEVNGSPENEPPLTMVVMFLSPETRPGDIRENVNLVAEDLPTALTLEEYTRLGITTEQQFFNDYHLLSSQNTRLAGAWPAHRVVFAASHNSIPMMFTQIWTVRGREAFVWTFADIAETFPKNVQVFERMLESITMD